MKKHAASDNGTYNDSTTDALYREYHRLPEDAATDLDDVASWAHTIINS